MTVEEHYKAVAPRLTNWLVATGSPYHNACDLVQETFLRIWKMREDLMDNDAAVAGLAFTIAKNLRKNYYRDNAKMDYIPDVPEDSSMTDDKAAHSDMEFLRRKLILALDALPPLLKEAYTLFQVGELSIREIAHETGASEDLVKVRIFRAKQKLQVLLKDENELTLFRGKGK